MATSQKRDFGYLCRVKKTHPKGPDMTGLLEINGVRFQLSSWVKVSKRGAKYLSLARLRAWTRTAIPSLPRRGKRMPANRVLHSFQIAYQQ
jgi:hypothetical protein